MTESPLFVREGLDADLIDALLRIPVVGHDATCHATRAPFDGLPLVDVPHSTPGDVDHAFDTARAAQVSWAATPVAERAHALLRFHDSLLTHREEGLDLLQWETGKTRMDALKELLTLAGVARHYARAAPRLLAPHRRRGVFPLVIRVSVEHQPVGVVANISPWNFPLFLACTDVLPALVAGNAVVLKPDHQTSLIALWAVDLLHRAGVPRRVLQVVIGHGSRLGPELVERADYVMFTGSPGVGARIASRCGERLIGCSLALGAKNPMIVTEDVDAGRASEVAIRACFDNAGQLGVGVERIYVVGAAYEPFVRRLLSRISTLRMSASVGWGSDYGSLINQEELDRVTAAVDDAVSKGAKVLTGGRPLPEIGPYYYAPTVLGDVTSQMRVNQEETFGPVVSVQRVGSEQEAVELANDSPFGLHASVMCGDPKRGVAIARRLRVGSVNVNEAYEATFGSTNAPMGGMGLSGLGRRNGTHGLLRFTEPQTIAIQNGIGFGTPPGMQHEEWGQMLTTGTSFLRRVGLD